MVEMRTISNAWARALVRELKRDGFATNGLLQGSGLKPDLIYQDDGSIPYRGHCALFETAARVTSDPMFGAKLGRNFELRNAGLIAYSGLSAGNLGEAIRNFSRFMRLVDSLEVLDIYVFDRIWSIISRPASPDAIQANMFGESLLNAACRTLTGSHVKPVGIYFPNKRPDIDQIEIDRFFGCPVHFGGPSRSDWDAADMIRPVVTADENLEKIIRRFGDRLLREIGDTNPDFTDRIAEAVIMQLPSGSTTTTALAAILGMSERTLRRRAADAGTKVSAVVGKTRARLAGQYLRSGQFKKKEIAFLCGYKSVAGFSAAQKRWKQPPI